MTFTTHRFRLATHSRPRQVDHSTQPPASNGDGIHRKAPVTACLRCRRLKKKCSKKPPQCETCVVAGQRCSLQNADASPTARTRQLEAKVDYLIRYINENVPCAALSLPLISPEVDPEANVTEPPSRPPYKRASAGERLYHAPPPDTPVQANAFAVQEFSANPEPSASSPSSELSPPVCRAGEPGSGWARPSYSLDPTTPSDCGHSILVNAYFRNVHRAYPFIDKTKVLASRQVFSSTGLRDCTDMDSRMLFLIMAIGSTTLARASKDFPAQSADFDVPYSDIVRDCLGHESMQSVQVLTLLALYSLFDCRGMSTWSIVRILSQQAMMQSLTRKAPNEHTLLSREAELRHRLFWSIFVLDRMMSTSLGQRAGLVDADIDVPLPTLTVMEFASPERPNCARMLQVSRHVIQLRELENHILASVHLRSRSEISRLGPSDRSAIIRRLRSHIDNWYGNGCLISLPEEDNLPIHNSVTWLNARYYHLLVLLFYPCHFNAHASYIGASELLNFVRTYVRYNNVLLADCQLPLNHVTLNRLIPVCLVFLHCFSCGESPHLPTKDDIISFNVLLQAFAPTWYKAHEAAAIMLEFSCLISSCDGAATANLGAGQPSHQAWLRSIRKQLVALSRDALGSNTCYQYTQDWDESVPLQFPVSHDFPGLGQSNELSTALRTSPVDLGFLH